MIRSRIMIAVMMTLSSSLLCADEVSWGDLSGRFTFVGKVPKPQPIEITLDKDGFDTPIHDESLIVNEDNFGVANVLVYLLPGRGQELPIHPSYERTADAKIEFAMNNGRFEPHILLLRTTQTMVQGNKDAVGHNANILFIHNSPM